MFKTDKSPGFYIHYTNRLYDNTLDRMIKDACIGCTNVHWSTLNQIMQFPGLTQRELAQKCFRDPSSITKILDILEAKGWIFRQGDTSDRRAFHIYITEQGQAIHDLIAPIAQELMSIATKNISQAELDTLYDILSRISLNILNKDDLTLID